MYFTSGSDRAFEQPMQTRPGAETKETVHPGAAGLPDRR